MSLGIDSSGPPSRVSFYPVIKNSSVYIQSYFKSSSGPVTVTENINGSGFLIRTGHSYFVITASTNVQQLIVGEGIVNVSKIFIYVQDVNGRGVSYIYEGQVVGIDGPSNVAVLRFSSFDDPSGWNYTLPRLCNQPYLTFGRSDCYPIGKPAYILGSITVCDFESLFTTTVANNDVFQATLNGFEGSYPIVPQIVLSSMTPAASSGFPGAPILSECGKVIGMINTTIGADPQKPIPAVIGYGTPQSVMEPLVNIFLAGPDSPLGYHLKKAPDGDYYIYNKGFIGIRYGPLMAKVLATIGNTTFKKWIGIVINEVVGVTESPFTKYLEAKDTILLTGINDFPIGTVPPTIAPTAVTYRLLPGNTVKLFFRLASQNFDILNTVEYVLQEWPDDFDFWGEGVL